MEQEEVLYVKTLGNQTGEIVVGLKKEDPDINIRIVYESLDSVCFVLNKISSENIDIEGLCKTILKEEPIKYNSYWQVNVGTKKKKIFDEETEPSTSRKTSTKSNSVNLAWRFL